MVCRVRRVRVRAPRYPQNLHDVTGVKNACIDFDLIDMSFRALLGGYEQTYGLWDLHLQKPHGLESSVFANGPSPLHVGRLSKATFSSTICIPIIIMAWTSKARS